MGKQRVLVVHCHSLFAELVASLLRQEQEIQVVEINVESDDLAPKIGQLTPDTITDDRGRHLGGVTLVIVDSQDAGLNAHARLQPLLELYPNLRVLCLTMGQPCPHTCPARCTRVNTKRELVEAMATQTRRVL